MNEASGGRPEARELPPTVSSSGEGPEPAIDGDLVGRILGGRYRILRKLGEGAMGAVYLGEHLKIGRQDAIKVLRDSLATDADTIARFVRGTRNVSMIRHPNICTIYDYSDTGDGAQFVAMEFVPGETLRDLLHREGRLPVEVAVQIARQAAEALDAAHEVGIVHRDLKPANIMVVRGRGGALEVKVVDFDIAKGSRDGEGEEVTRMGFVVGTPEYMSPEQLIGDRLDGRSDIYSLALVLYRMLTGTLPFTAQDTQDLMVKRLTEEPMSLAAGLPTVSFPAALEAALRRALQRKPSDRQATAGEFGREIAAAIDHPATLAAGASGAAAGASGARTSSAEPRRRPIPRAVKAAAAGAVVLTLSVAALFAFGGDDGQVPLVPTSSVDPSTNIVEYSDPVSGADDAAETEPGPEESRPSPPRDDRSAPPAGSPTPVETRPRARTGDELLSLLERLTADPTPATLAAARDTAAATWAHPTAPALDRATAAYVVASAWISLGDIAQGVTWLQRAVDLRPDYGPYRSELQAYQQLLGGN